MTDAAKGGSASRLRVLALIDSLTAGGAEMLLSDFAAGAPAAGIELTVAYLGEADDSPAAARLQAQGIEPFHVGMNGLLSPSTFARVRRAIRSAGPDLVHTHLAYSDALGGPAARSLRIPTISTVHVMEWEQARRDRARNRLMAAVRRRAAALVVAVSHAARRALIEGGWERADRVVTVHNGIAAAPAIGAGPEVRRELGIAPDEIVIAQLGVLRAGKGHEAAARAVARLRVGHPKLRLLVVGEGPARPEVERALEPLGEAALLTGHRGDVMEVLDAADLLVHPSRVDAFPTALLEAMAAGVPVVASSVGGIPEIVVPGETGVLVPPPYGEFELVEAMAPLVHDPDLKRRLAEAARRRFQQEFTAERWAQRMRAIYDAVAGSRPLEEARRAASTTASGSIGA